MGHSIVKQHQAIQQTVYKVALKSEVSNFLHFFKFSIRSVTLSSSFYMKK